jgi:xylulokinase
MAALAREPAPVQRMGARWEMDPAAFLNAVAILCSRLRQVAPRLFEALGAVSFATQTNSFLLLDGNDRPVSPILLWPDTRAAEFAETLRSRLDASQLVARTGVPAYDPQFAAAKLLWLQEHQPEAWSRARRFCLLSDYLTLMLSGRHATEAGAAGLLGLVDIHAPAWIHGACDAVGLPADWLPEVVRAGTDLGPARGPSARDCQLPPDCRVVAGCLDQYAGALGAGNVVPGGVSETTGTVLATVRYTQQFANGSPLFQGPAWHEGGYYQMAFGSTSANLLEAYRKHLPDTPPFEALTQEAAAVPPGANGYRLCADPGNAAPDALVHGSGQPSRGEAVRAILEGVADALAGQIDALCGSDRPDRVRSVGGAARSDLWLRIKATRLGIPVQATLCEEPTSLGAALLAAHALGEPLEQVSERWVRVREPVFPAG